MSYQDTRWDRVGSYPSAETQSVYSTAPAVWARLIFSFEHGFCLCACVPRFLCFWMLVCLCICCIYVYLRIYWYASSHIYTCFRCLLLGRSEAKEEGMKREEMGEEGMGKELLQSEWFLLSDECIKHETQCYRHYQVMYIYIYIYICILFIYIYIYIHIIYIISNKAFIHTHAYTRTHTHIYMCVCARACVCVCIKVLSLIPTTI